MTKRHFRDFLKFIRDQGIIGLAVGFILGGAISKVITSLVEDIINPILGIFLGATEDLAGLSLNISGVEIRWGNFVSVAVDFLIIAFLVYFVTRTLKIEDLKVKGKKLLKKK